VLRVAARRPRSEYTLAASLRANGRVVGSGALFIRNERFRTGEIAYIVHPDHWGQGLATEIANILLKCACEEFRLHRIYATCDPRDIGSGRVLPKIGMVHESRLRHSMLLRDGWRDSDVYADLEHEWVSRFPVGGAPRYSPRWVADSVSRAATPSPSARRSSIVTRRSGKAVRRAG
jgi:RimJ/RimL family protein N-acetyltransferase